MDQRKLPNHDYLAAWNRTSGGANDHEGGRAFLSLLRAFLREVRRLIRRGVRRPEVLEQARNVVDAAIRRCETLPPSSRKTATLAALRGARLWLDAAIAGHGQDGPRPGAIDRPTRA